MGENSRILTESKCRNCTRAMQFKIESDNMWHVVCSVLEYPTLPMGECKDYVEED